MICNFTSQAVIEKHDALFISDEAWPISTAVLYIVPQYADPLFISDELMVQILLLKLTMILKRTELLFAWLVSC